MMNTLKIEGAKNNIKINAVCPVAATRMTEGLMPEEVLAQLKPEYVTPGVMNLVKQDAPTGMILSAGAGAFSMAEIVETRGAYVGQGDALTAEAVRPISAAARVRCSRSATATKMRNCSRVICSSNFFEWYVHDYSLE